MYVYQVYLGLLILSVCLNLTLVMINPDIPCLCKECRSDQLASFRSQLIWICSLSICMWIYSNNLEQANSDLLKIRSGRGILIYLAWEGLIPIGELVLDWVFCLSAWPFDCQPRWLSWMRHPTGDQEVAGSSPAEIGNILSWRLIMKYFLRSFSLIRWFKKGSCQFLAKECTILVNRLED